VRFDAPSVDEVAAEIARGGVAPQTADACARLALGDASQANELAGSEGSALRAAAEQFARAVLAGASGEVRPWLDLLAAVRARGEATKSELEERADEELELYPRKERKRVETEWAERIRRSRRRVETKELDLGLQLVTLWLEDLAFLNWDARDLVRNTDRLDELQADSGVDSARLREAIELIEDTRQRFQLNVSEDLACEALAYRLEAALGS
jgi:DNA polymerase-3 subunit delta'